MLTPQQRLLRRDWLLEQLPQLLGEAAYHRTHQEPESHSVFVLWHANAPRGSLPLGDPVTDWQGLAAQLRHLDVDDELVAAVLAVFALNDFKGALPSLFPDPPGAVSLRWRLPGVDQVIEVRKDGVILHGAETVTTSWTGDPLRRLLDRVRQASRVAG